MELFSIRIQRTFQLVSTPKEKKAEQYSGVLKLFIKNYPVKMISKLEGVSVSTVQRLKKEFCL